MICRIVLDYFYIMHYTADISVLEDVISNAEKEIVEKEAAWRKEYLRQYRTEIE